MSNQAFTMNSKTLLSVDFDRFKTCPQICDYCYVGNLERIYPAYKEKLTRNTEWAHKNPIEFADTLNREYMKYRKSKSVKFDRLDKLPARIYGSGDFIPEHLEFMKKLDFKFYIISKSLTDPAWKGYLDELIKLPNLTKVILSLDNQNINNASYTETYYGKDKFGIAYTGEVDDFAKLKQDGLITTIFFNISNKKADMLKSRDHVEQCPCDTGRLAHNKACSFCSKCWRSSVTKTRGWNLINKGDESHGKYTRNL